MASVTVDQKGQRTNSSVSLLIMSTCSTGNICISLAVLQIFVKRFDVPKAMSLYTH